MRICIAGWLGAVLATVGVASMVISPVSAAATPATAATAPVVSPQVAGVRPVSAAGDSRSHAASGSLVVTAQSVDSVRQVGGNTIMVVTLTDRSLKPTSR